MNYIEQLRDYKRGVEIIYDWIGSGGVPVDKELAQKRADTCLVCPKNVSGYKLTESIADSIREAIELKNHLSLKVDGEKKLLVCEACGCVNRLAIWCPISSTNHSYSKEELVEKFPSNCYKRTEQNL